MEPKLLGTVQTPEIDLLVFVYSEKRYLPSSDVNQGLASPAGLSVTQREGSCFPAVRHMESTKDPVMFGEPQVVTGARV